MDTIKLIIWDGGEINLIKKYTRTIFVTDKCNLKCSYCYETDKQYKTIDIETAKLAVDLFIKDLIEENDFNITFELMGGEVFIELPLLKQITDYIFKKSIEARFITESITISFSSNGTFFTQEVKDYLLDLKKVFNVSLGISLDGCREAHELNREGSFDKLIEGFDWWRKEFPENRIKATLSSNTLDLLPKSVKYLIEELDIDDIKMNFANENIWKEDDYKRYFDALIVTANYLLESGYYKTRKISIFSRMFIDDTLCRDKYAWCGCGIAMLSCGIDGRLSPCHRCASQSCYYCGDVNTGIDYKKLVPFIVNTPYQDSKCASCKYIRSCWWCIAGSIEDTGDLFKRTYYGCGLHIAQCKANEYYWSEVDKLNGN